MAKIILITGGARSGKSSYALQIAKKYKGKKAFIATAVAFDNEMKERIIKHKKQRKKSFFTIEEPYEITKAIKKAEKKFSVILIDCITVWLGNLFYKYNNNEKIILDIIQKFLEILKKIKTDVIIVTNETGWGIVPENKTARIFRDMAGYLNKKTAEIASEVYLMCCGIYIKIK